MTEACPLCGSVEEPTLHLSYGPYLWVRCANCPFAYQTPYVGEHNRHTADSEIANTYQSHTEESTPVRVTAEKCKWILNAVTREKVLCLEIGPGRGQLLERIGRERPEWKLLAVESYPPFIRALADREIASFESLSQLTANSDVLAYARSSTEIVVIADNVLEHLEYPRDVLMNLVNFASTVALPLTVLVEVPNENGLRWRASVQDYLRGFKKPPTFPGHINLFERSTLARLARGCGFQNVEVAGHGLRTRDQLEYAMRDKVRSHLAPLVIKGLSFVPVDTWLGLCYWIRGTFRYSHREIATSFESVSSNRLPRNGPRQD